MSEVAIAVRSPGGAAGELRSRWAQRSPRARTTLRLTALLAATTAAYHYSLLSLLQSLSLETPLAYVGLVPVMALLLAALRARPLKPEPLINDRQVDYIVAVPLLVAALAINVLMPRQLSTMFWVWRIDLFTLPFFVAGAVALLFGVRVLWRQRLAISFLMLAWPLPYSVLLLRFLTKFTNGTLGGLKLVLKVVHVATPQPSANGSLFQVAHAGRSFPISVVSACSGVNGMVGFLLVGVAFGAVVRGPRIRKALWLTAGLALLWLINLGRILFIFWAGKVWGSQWPSMCCTPTSASSPSTSASSSCWWRCGPSGWRSAAATGSPLLQRRSAPPCARLPCRRRRPPSSQWPCSAGCWRSPTRT